MRIRKEGLRREKKQKKKKEESVGKETEVQGALIAGSRPQGKEGRRKREGQRERGTGEESGIVSRGALGATRLLGDVPKAEGNCQPNPPET